MQRDADATGRCAEMSLVRVVFLEQDVQTRFRSLSLLAGFIFGLYQLKIHVHKMFCVGLFWQQMVLSSFVPCKVKNDEYSAAVTAVVRIIIQ